MRAMLSIAHTRRPLTLAVMQDHVELITVRVFPHTLRFFFGFLWVLCGLLDELLFATL